MQVVAAIMSCVRPFRRWLFLAMLLSGGLASGWYVLHTSKPVFRLKHIYVKPQAQVDDGWLAEQLEPWLSSDLLSLPLPVISSKLHTNPWVKSVKLRRKLPSSLTIELELHQPIVKWNHDGYLTAAGELIAVSQLAKWKALPLLEGPDDQLGLVWEMYQYCQRQVSTVPLAISGLVLTPWGSWRLMMDDKIEIAIGKRNSGERLNRFVRAYASMPLLREAQRPVYIDLRYSNGIAINWQTELNVEKG